MAEDVLDEWGNPKPPPRPRVKWWGKCQRCNEWSDRGFIPGTDWLVCIDCYITWRNLPDDHPAKAVTHA